MKTTDNNTQTKGIVNLSLTSISLSEANPRKSIDEKALNELSESIKQFGVLQPILVRAKGKKYEIIYGERRFRASQLANLTEIPVTIIEATDEDALDMAITENLHRQDISPIEEATAYKMLLDTNRYDIASLIAKFGKSELYIKGRLKLNDLTPNILTLLQEDKITIGIACELCKYDTDIQEEIYEQHLTDDCRNSWRELTVKRFYSEVKSSYTCDLNNYNFDKTKCADCYSNTLNRSLFTEFGTCGYCTNKACLKAKTTEYIVAKCAELLKENPKLILCQHYCNANNDAVKILSENGHEIKQLNYNLSTYPTDPQEQEKLKASNLYLCIENKDLKLYYSAPITKYGEKEITDPTEKLCQQDKRNKEIAIEKTVDEVKGIIKNTTCLQGDYSAYEERMLYYSMLPKLRAETRKVLGIESRWGLTGEETLTILKNLTDEIKILITRDFIIANLMEANGVSLKSKFMLDFVRQHRPEEVAEVETKHNDVYKKRHDRIEERITAIENQEQTQEQEQDSEEDND